MAILDADKLSIYNGALLRLGSRPLASLTENREPRRVLDQIWGTSSELVSAALEKGDWNFATRTVEGVYTPAIEPSFGFQRAYDKPTDFRRLTSLSADPYFRTPLVDEQYVDESDYWFTDYDVLYVRYVSDDGSYGFSSAKWTESFKEYLEAWAAWKACSRITNSTAKRDRLDREMDMALRTTKSQDAMNEGVKFPPRGSWARSRGQKTREHG